MCEKAAVNPSVSMQVSNRYKSQRCVKKLLLLVLLCEIVSLIAIKVRKCVKKLFPKNLLHYNIVFVSLKK